MSVRSAPGAVFRVISEALCKEDPYSPGPRRPVQLAASLAETQVATIVRPSHD